MRLEVAPVAVLNVPPGHSEQAPAPVVKPKLPGRHRVHVALPGLLKEPLEQLVQDTMEMLPDAFDAVPAGQRAQDPLWVTLLYEPEAQARHEELPGGLYVPIGQGEHGAGLVLPVALPAVPALHKEHVAVPGDSE